MMAVYHGVNPRSRWRCASVVGALLGAMAAAGCDAGAPAGGEANQTGGTAPSAGASTTPAAKGKLDTTSRRQHQKQQAGQAPAAK